MSDSTDDPSKRYPIAKLHDTVASHHSVPDRDVTANPKQSLLLLQNLLRTQTDPEFDRLYINYKKEGYYPKYDNELIIALAEVLDNYQDQPCLTHQRTGNTLRDIICQMTLTYVPLALRDTELQQNASLIKGSRIGRGTFGEVYKTEFAGHNLVIKTPLASPAYLLPPEKIHEIILQETFFNFCIVNRLIEEKGISQLVPTYGFFLCDKPSTKESLPICVEGSKYPWFYLIQKYIEGDVLANKLSTMTLPELIPILSQVFSVLITLQESEYQIAHNDLHIGNIMITPKNNVYILDWGQVTFTYKGKRYRGRQETEYNPDNVPLVTGANDIYFLLMSIVTKTRDKDIITWIEAALNILFTNPSLKIARKHDFRLLDINGKQTQWLFKSLSQFENVLEQYDNRYGDNQRHHIHNYNIRVLNKLTYRDISTRLKLDIIPFSVPDMTEHTATASSMSDAAVDRKAAQPSRSVMNARRDKVDIDFDVDVDIDFDVDIDVDVVGFKKPSQLSYAAAAAAPSKKQSNKSPRAKSPRAKSPRAKSPRAKSPRRAKSPNRAKSPRAKK